MLAVVALGMTLTQYLATAPSPADYVVSKFRQADVIFMAEDHGVRQNLEFLRRLIPSLYAHGVRIIGMEFGAAEDQAALDRLTTGRTYDADAARRIMFSYNTSWAYQEYMDIYRGAWEFNRRLPAGKPKFRILNLSYRYNWRGATTARGVAQDAKIFPHGVPERFRAETTLREVVRKGLKMLAYVGTPHAFTAFHYPVYDYLSVGFTRFVDIDFGGLVFGKIGRRAKTILLHQPFYAKDYRPIQPAGGALEEAFRDAGSRPCGFDLGNSPAGRLEERGAYAFGRKHVTMGDIADGYVMLAPLGSLRGCTVDRQFLTEANIAEALANFADPGWHVRPTDLASYYKQIEQFVDVQQRYAGLSGSK